MAPSAFLRPFSRPAFDRPVRLVRGEGALVWDADGNEYVDSMASLWYCQVGHGRAEIADAVSAQLRRLDAYHCFDPFTNEPAEALAAEIAGLSPIMGARVFFTTSGSEAVDTALKLARLTHALSGEPGRVVLAGRDRSYHGTAWGGTSVQGLDANQAGYGPLLGDVVRIPHDDIDAAAAVLSRVGERLAAVIAEPVLGAGGVHPAPPGYLRGLRRLCDHHGALLVVDEVITGFGRLGSWFASGEEGVEPDLITFAKGVTSGYQPLGGVVVGERVRAALEADPDYVLRTGFTYSGHPASCAAGIANVGILRDEALAARADVIEAQLGGGLRALADDGVVPGVRGRGGMWAVEVPEGRTGAEARDRLLGLGVMARALDGAVAFCPPLMIPTGLLDRVVDAVATLSASW